MNSSWAVIGHLSRHLSVYGWMGGRVMAWDLRAPNAALGRWQRHLRQSGHPETKIQASAAAVTEFLKFLEEEGTAGVPAPRPLPPTRPSTGAAIPPALEDLLSDWTVGGQPAQRGIRWPRDRWLAEFRGHSELLRALPELVTRDDVRAIARNATRGPREAEAALLVSLLWGYGSVGYGPYRTRRILSGTPDAPERLHRVALTLGADGPVAAYERLAGDCRLAYLGPAFGTKYLAFAQPAEHEVTALIHDNLVSEWLRRNGRADLGSIGWSPSRYERYLERMHAWARALRCAAELLEYLIFQAMADEAGGQWRQ